jgi:hypothetical protein
MGELHLWVTKQLWRSMIENAGEVKYIYQRMLQEFNERTGTNGRRKLKAIKEK